MRSIIRRVAAVLMVVLPLAACASQGSGLPLLQAAKNTDADYRLGPGDKLHIQVLGAEDLTGDYTVADNGTISTPLIGDIQAAGSTRAGVERAMEKKLAQGYLKNPKVSVTILQYRPFYIFGEVTKPGGYPFASGMRVVNAVATAGGYTYRANQDFVIVSRDGQERKALPTTPIQPDDVIKVPERYF